MLARLPLPVSTASSVAPDTRGSGTGLLTHRVPRGDVADLVAEHRRELRLAVEIGHDAARDVDVAARQREGIRLLAVEDRKRPGEIGAFSLGSDALPDLVDISLQALVVVPSVLLEDLRVHLAPDVDLLFLGHRDDVRAAGGGIARTARRNDRAAGNRGKHDPPSNRGGHRVPLGRGPPKSRGPPPRGKVPAPAPHRAA